MPAGIPGTDCQDSFAPVVNDMTWRVMSIICLSGSNGHHTDQVDTTTAFLHGDLDESLHMSAPEGCPVPQGTALMLNKAMCGLVVASRQSMAPKMGKTSHANMWIPEKLD